MIPEDINLREILSREVSSLPGREINKLIGEVREATKNFCYYSSDGERWQPVSCYLKESVNLPVEGAPDTTVGWINLPMLSRYIIYKWGGNRTLIGGNNLPRYGGGEVITVGDMIEALPTWNEHIQKKLVELGYTLAPEETEENLCVPEFTKRQYKMIKLIGITPELQKEEERLRQRYQREKKAFEDIANELRNHERLYGKMTPLQENHGITAELDAMRLREMGAACIRALMEQEELRMEWGKGVREELEELIRTRAHDGQITVEYAEIDLIHPSGET